MSDRHPVGSHAALIAEMVEIHRLAGERMTEIADLLALAAELAGALKTLNAGLDELHADECRDCNPQEDGHSPLCAALSRIQTNDVANVLRRAEAAGIKPKEG